MVIVRVRVSGGSANAEKTSVVHGTARATLEVRLNQTEDSLSSHHRRSSPTMVDQGHGLLPGSDTLPWVLALAGQEAMMTQPTVLDPTPATGRLLIKP